MLLLRGRHSLKVPVSVNQIKQLDIAYAAFYHTYVLLHKKEGDSMQISLINHFGTSIYQYSLDFDAEYFLMPTDDQLILPAPQHNFLLLIDLRKKRTKKMEYQFATKIKGNFQALIFGHTKLLCFV